MTAWLDTPDSPADPARDPRRAAALDRWLTEDRDRVAILLRQNRELTEEIMRQDDALLDAYDRIDELVDALYQPRQPVEWLMLELDWWRGLAGIATVAALTLGAVLVARMLGGL